MRYTSDWEPQDIIGARLLGDVEVNEEHLFTIVETDTHLVFGSVCNVGLLESGNFEKDSAFSTDENLQQLIYDLESYYDYGPGYQSINFRHNERM